MDNLLQDKCIIVCDYEYFPFVFQLKGEHPEAEWKLFRKDDLLDRICFSFSRDPIPYLMSHGVDYSNAKKFLRLFRVADISKRGDLSSRFNDLKENGFIQTDEFGMLEVSRSHLYLLELEEDSELHALLRRKGIPFTDITLADLGAKKRLSDGEKPTLLSFPNKFTQYFYIYAQIRKEILLDDEMKNRISILINDESDLYYVKTVSSLFGLPSFATFLRPFLSDPKVKAKVTDIFRKKDFAFSEEESADPDLAALRKIVEHYGLASFDFDFAYASLLEIANTLGVQERMDDKGITIENRFNIDPSARIFVTNFQYDAFYKVYDDKNVLTDQEMVDISANPSYVLTRLDRRKKLNFILYNDIAFLSRVRQHLTDKIYDSQFLAELGWDPKIDVVKVGMSKEGVYTSAAGRLFLADQLDKEFYPFHYGGYRSYDHSFKGLNRTISKADDNWSVTNLEGYIHCPFQYYMKKVLPEASDDKHAMWRGILIHKTLEHVLATDFDFDKAFAEGASAYKKAMARDKVPCDEKEETWLSIIEFWLRRLIPAFRHVITHSEIAEEIAEKKVTFTLKGSDGTKYVFDNAGVDKILVTRNGEERFYTIIDYKSGKESFNYRHVFLGPSTQLPLYYYALETTPIWDDKVLFGAFGIVHSYASSPGKVFRDEEYLRSEKAQTLVKLGGVSRGYIPFVQSIDPDSITTKGKVSKKGGSFFKGGLLFESEEEEGENIVPGLDPNCPYNFKRLIDDAKEAIVGIIERVLANQFPIAPTSMDLKAKDFTRLVCGHCPYGDVCYHDAKRDGVSYSQAIHDHFHPDDILGEEMDEEESEEDDDE